MLKGVKDAITDALSIASARGSSYSANDVLGLCHQAIPLPEVIAHLDALVDQGTYVRIDVADEPSSLYCQMSTARLWWVERVLRWHVSDTKALTTEELASSMSVTFGTTVWEQPAPQLLELGEEMMMISRTTDPTRFVSPWLTFMNNVVDARGFLAGAVRSMDTNSLDPTGLPDAGVGAILDSLSERERIVIFERFFEGATLEEVGERLYLTRERVRQIQRVGLARLGRAPIVNSIRCAVVREFVEAGCSLVVGTESKLMGSSLMQSTLNLGICYLDDVEVQVICDRSWADSYSVAMDSNQSLVDFSLAEFRELPCPIKDLLAELPLADAIKLAELTRTNLRRRSAKLTRKMQTYIALRRIGASAHYTEIADECGQIWPERPIPRLSCLNTLVAMSKAGELGVVWIGRKGMYGLEEHGYSRPYATLEDTAADIVWQLYARSNAPVTFGQIMREMTQFRRESSEKSVLMALSFSERVKRLSGDKFVPVTNTKGGTPQRLDFSGALSAFERESEP